MRKISFKNKKEPMRLSIFCPEKRDMSLAFFHRAVEFSQYLVFPSLARRTKFVISSYLVPNEIRILLLTSKRNENTTVKILSKIISKYKTDV